MKKILFILLFLVPSLCFAQLDSIKSKPYEQYCMIIIANHSFNTKVSIIIDYGQRAKAFSDQTLKDESGNDMEFNSPTDAMNYMGLKGWLFTGTAVFQWTTNNGLRYIFRKPAVSN